VPAYDPQVVYVDQPYYDYNGPFFAYGPPYEAGVWLTFGCNWGGHGVVVVDRGYWGDGRSWRRDPYSVSITVNINERPHPWAFPSGRARPQAPSNWRQSPQVTNPRPFAATPPPRPPQAAYRDIRTRGPAAVGVVSSNPAAFKGRPINTAIMPHTAGPARTQQASAPRSPASPTSQYDRPATAPKPATSPAQPRYPATPPSQYERPATPAVHPATPQYSETERVAPKMEPKAPVVDEKRPVQAPPRIETEHAPTVGHAETVTRPEELHPADDKGGPHPDVKKAPKPTAPKEQPKPEEKRDDPNR
jgi:hypothetical protein